jgi:DNA-binding PadR family transcriptional regulator
MSIPQVISELQQRANSDGEIPIESLQAATMETARYVVFSLGSGNPDQLGPLSSALTQLTERYFAGSSQKDETPREWMRCLAVVGQIAMGAYESFGPSAEARKVLEGSAHARNIIEALVGRERLQAAELRSIMGIEHQPVVARIIHTLSKARLVIVERGPGNTAWYRLTAEGRRAAKANEEQAGKAGQDSSEKIQLATAGAASHR